MSLVGTDPTDVDRDRELVLVGALGEYLRYTLNMAGGTPTATLDRTLAALAHPVRREILDRLISGRRSVGELAEPFEISLPAVSMHIRALQKAGLVTQSRDGQLRPCRLDAAPMVEVATWLERYRVFWEQSLDRLDTYAQMVGEGAPGGAGSAE